jgi:hypothetical protein
VEAEDGEEGAGRADGDGNGDGDDEAMASTRKCVVRLESKISGCALPCFDADALGHDRRRRAARMGPACARRG